MADDRVCCSTPRDPEALARGVLAVDLRELPARRAAVRAHFDAHLSFAALARRLEAIYRRLLERRTAMSGARGGARWDQSPRRLRLAWITPTYQLDAADAWSPGLTALAHRLAEQHDLVVYSLHSRGARERFRIGTGRGLRVSRRSARQRTGDQASRAVRTRDRYAASALAPPAPRRRACALGDRAGVRGRNRRAVMLPSSTPGVCDGRGAGISARDRVRRRAHRRWPLLPGSWSESRAHDDSRVALACRGASNARRRRDAEWL